jgi:hypothetical protein
MLWATKMGGLCATGNRPERMQERRPVPVRVGAAFLGTSGTGGGCSPDPGLHARGEEIAGLGMHRPDAGS